MKGVNMLTKEKGKLNQFKNKAKQVLTEEREGAEVFEYVLIVSLLVALIIVLFNVVGPAFMEKMEEIANNIRTSGSDMIFGNGGVTPTP